MSSLTAADVRRYKQVCRDDWHFFRSHEQWIRPKTAGVGGGVILFKHLKPGQLKIQRAMDAMLKEEGRCLIDVFKARKVGASTFWESIADHLCNTQEAFHAGIASMSTEATDILYEIGRTFVRSRNRGRAENACIPWPIVEKCNENEVIYGNGSMMRVGTAGESGRKKDLFRGMTPYLILASEIAFWSNAGYTWNGMINSIETKKGSRAYAIRESTSNGVTGIGKFWYDVYRAHVAGDTDRRMVFISWMDDDESVSQPSEREFDFFDQWNEAQRQGYVQLADRLAEQLDATLRFKEYEQNLVLEYGANLQQLRWYADYWREKTDGTEEERAAKRAQECASTPEESFQSTNNPTFPSELLRKLMSARPTSVVVGVELAPLLQPQIVTPYMNVGGLQIPVGNASVQHVAVEGGREVLSDAVPRYSDSDGVIYRVDVWAKKDGSVELFDLPEALDGRDLYVGIDVSCGSDAAGADSTAAAVMSYDRSTGIWYESCMYCEQGLVPDDAADEIEPVLRLYGNPMVDAELPGPGDQLIQRLMRHHAYGNMYRRRTVSGKVIGTTVGVEAGRGEQSVHAQSPEGAFEEGQACAALPCHHRTVHSHDR